MATAESLTGGRLAAELTSVPGASESYRGGVVAYATEVKIDVLGVPADLVAQHGVISAECARAMADGVRRRLRADLGVATTGVAGPATQDGRPPGTVFVAVAHAEDTAVLGLELAGTRSEIVEATVREALSALDEVLRRQRTAHDPP